MSLETLLKKVSFLSQTNDGNLAVSLGNTSGTEQNRVAMEQGHVKTRLTLVKEYCNDSGNRGLHVNLRYNMSYDPIEFFTSLLETVMPVLELTRILELRLSHGHGPPTVEPTPRFEKTLQDAARLLAHRDVEVHLDVHELSGKSTADRLFATGICKAVREKFRKLITRLEFYDRGHFTEDGRLCYEDNEETKSRELGEFFVKLPFEIPHLKQVIGGFPIFARTGKKIVAYHTTKVTVKGEKICIVDDRPVTGEVEGNKLEGEKGGFRATRRTVPKQMCRPLEDVKDAWRASKASGAGAVLLMRELLSIRDIVTDMVQEAVTSPGKFGKDQLLARLALLHKFSGTGGTEIIRIGRRVEESAAELLSRLAVEDERSLWRFHLLLELSVPDLCEKIYM